MFSGLRRIPAIPRADPRFTRGNVGVAKTRHHGTAECLHLAESLQDLVNFLEEFQKQVKDDLSNSGDPQEATAALQRSQSLSDRVKNLSFDINEILKEGQKLREGRTIHRFIRGGEDAATLKSLNDRVLKAHMRFQLQGSISIEMVVNQIFKAAQMAELDSIESVDAGYRARKSKWLEGTRTQLLADIEDWSTGRGKDDARAKAPIFVLVGAAGTGKSTIAVQVAKTLDNEGALGGSFFFERGIEKISATRFVFPTLAVQLARSHKKLAPYIVKGISKHRQRGNQQYMSYALDELIIEPLKRVPKEQWPLRPIIFVLDALDECNDQDQIPEMLYLLLKRIRSLDFPLRLFLTTRPEYRIREVFDSIEWQSEPDPFQLHSIPTSTVRHDIKLFIEHRLKEIGIIERIKGIRDDAIDELTDAANRLFIYASTCLEFLNEHKANLGRTLELILSHRLKVSALDNLYNFVLENAFPEDAMCHPDLELSVPTVLGALAVLQDQLCPKSLSDLLALEDSITRQILDRLRSILTFGTDVEPISLLHASFPQYLADPRRCRIPSIRDSPSFRGHDCLAAQCLETLQYGNTLKRNICNLEDPLVFRNEILDLDKRLSTSLPSHVQYACLHWSVHLSDSLPSSKRTNLLKEFAETKLLNWMEALAMMGRVEMIVAALNRVLKWYKLDDDTRALLHDGLRFISAFMACIQTCPFHIYTSCLAFTPSKCLLRQVYLRREDFLPTVDVPVGLDETWGACLRVMEGHIKPVDSVTFSPNGQWIASASDDKNINVWDAHSGVLLRTLSGHTECVSNCIFSSDDEIISGSVDGTIRFWNMKTGIPSRVIHLDDEDIPVLFVALLPTSNTLDVPRRIAVIRPLHNLQILDMDGRLLTQRSWDGSTGCLTVLDWSADGRYIAIAHEKTIILYDTISSCIWKELVGHEDDVLDLKMISQPRMDLLVSSGNDCTVRLWNLETQECVHIFTGHTSWVSAVAVDPSYATIASASQDGTIRLWSIEHKTCLTVFPCNSSRSLAFSPNGRMLVSGHMDSVIRIWDVDHRAVLPQEYTSTFNREGVLCTFSSDCQFLAAQAERGAPTVDVWRLRDDHFIATIKRERTHFSVRSVAASPDSSWVAIGEASPSEMTRSIQLTNTLTKETFTIAYTHAKTEHWKLGGVSSDGRRIYLHGYDSRYRRIRWKIFNRDTKQSINLDGSWIGGVIAT
ncbi:hypothetical protein ONZ45_g12449 [Pleurotus djamor]|nr:hypothetical protein ONZ45_g12449 [Pleurotus djamor]